MSSELLKLRNSLRFEAEERTRGRDGDRFVDFGLELRVVRGDAAGVEVLPGKPPLALVRTVRLGGVWDRALRRFVGETKDPIVWYLSKRQAAIVLDQLSFAPDFHPLPLRMVDREEDGLGVLREIAEGDVLLVAGIVGESEGVPVEGMNEPLRPAAMLHIGPAGFRSGGDEDRGAFRQIGAERVGHFGVARLTLQLGIAIARAEMLLHRPD